MPSDDAEYGALFGILNGDKTFEDWPKNQDSSLRQRVYKKWKSSQEMKEVHDPMTGNTVQRIVHTNTGSIVIKKSELSSIVHCYYDQSKGDGAVKLMKSIRHRYSGLSRNFIEKPQCDERNLENKASFAKQGSTSPYKSR